ncbi:PrpF domain-containing protein [Algiphilus sp.]|uniref:PrpF domain-containing protein n=1 Tax=Algiphilus sp. TaxID=1872431 RepID=UPI003B52D617
MHRVTPASVAAATLPAVFMRGGTSRGLVIKAADLPAEPKTRDALLLNALGSPDGFGRQLNGMGSGSSSTSKVCVVAPSQREDADVDYTFLQVRIEVARVESRGNCGNMVAAVAAFAVDEGWVSTTGKHARVRIYNTNTGRLIHARVPLRDGARDPHGDCVIPGVSGPGAAIALDFLDPGGAITGALFPTGRHRDTADDGTPISCVDAGNACVFVRDTDVGLRGDAHPDAIAADQSLMERLLALRAEAAVRMGIAADRAQAEAERMIPYLVVVSPPTAATTLDGGTLEANAMDGSVRVIASGQPHRAVPLTVALCTAAAAMLPDTVVADCMHPSQDAQLRLGMPSGVLSVHADVSHDTALGWRVVSGGFQRTARWLMRGLVNAG